MDWRSIVEPDPPAEEPVLLRGLLATEPASCGRRRRHRFISLGALALLFYRLIAWSIAGVAHIAAAFILMSIYLDLRGPDDALLWASLHRGNAGEEGKLLEMSELEMIREAPETPEADPEARPEPLLESVPEAPVVPQVTPPVAPSPDPAAGPASESPRPASVGAGASAEGSPLSAEATARQIELDPTEALRARRAGDLKKLQGGNPADIVVVSGTYDRVEDVLVKLGIPHRVITPPELPLADLSGTLILLVDCAECYAAFAMRTVNTKVAEKQIAALEKREKELERQVDRTRDLKAVFRLKVELMSVTSELESLRRQMSSLDFPNRVVEKAREFVLGGGYLFTSDWGLTILEQAFPGYVSNGGSVGPRTVKLQPGARFEGHALLQEVFLRASAGGAPLARTFRWEIDSASYYVKVGRPEVEALVESPDLQKHRSVAVTFSPEGGGHGRPAGKVLHVLSHFQRQATREGDYALQNMLLNFMLDRVKAK
jgi:hypothetical protein